MSRYFMVHCVLSDIKLLLVHFVQNAERLKKDMSTVER